MWRRVPLAVKMLVLIGLVGAAVWATLDLVQTARVRKVLTSELAERLEQQSRKNRTRFDAYVIAYERTARLTAARKDLIDYVQGAVFMRSRTMRRYRDDIPPWLPQPSVLRSLVRIRYAALLDLPGRVREFFQYRSADPPPALLRPTPLLVMLSRSQSYMTLIEGAPYLITSTDVEGRGGSPAAILMLACPLDAEFLEQSQGPGSQGDIIALLKEDGLTVVASSRPELLPPGSSLAAEKEKFVVMGKSFFDQGASDLLVQFTSLAATSEVEAVGAAILKTDKQHRVLASLVLILTFAAIMFRLTRRVRGVTETITDFSQRVLKVPGTDAAVSGDELFILETQFQRLADEIARNREALLAKTRELEQKVRERTQDLAAAAARAESASKAKSDFLANMSHELRTPLSNVIGFSEVIADGSAGPVSAEQMRYLDIIADNGRHLLGLINDLLDLSKIESGRMDLELCTINLKRLIEDVVSLFSEAAAKQRIDLAADIDGSVGMAAVDERKLKQVLINLMGNALKFTPEGGSVRVSVRRVGSQQSAFGSQRLSTEDDRLTTEAIEISVEDTGIGIKDEDIPKLFQPFQQLESAMTKRFKGTGLGLALSKQYVELHGGVFSVESRAGAGSRFSFVLPLHPEAAVKQ